MKPKSNPAASKLSAGFASMRDDPSGNMQKVQTAAGEMKKATSQMASIPPSRKQRPILCAPANRYFLKLAGSFIHPASLRK
jgi:hypothetical protein